MLCQELKDKQYQISRGDNYNNFYIGQQNFYVPSVTAPLSPLLRPNKLINLSAANKTFISKLTYCEAEKLYFTFPHQAQRDNKTKIMLWGSFMASLEVITNTCQLEIHFSMRIKQNLGTEGEK